MQIGKTRLVVLLVVAMMLATVGATPSFALNNAGGSLDTRNAHSLQGNFGQCHQSPSGIANYFGGDLQQGNPNPNNRGEAACRNVGNQEGGDSLFTNFLCDSQPPGFCPRLGPGRGSQGR